MPRNGIGVGFVGAGNVLGAYLQQLDRLVARGLAREGPVACRDRSRWEGLSARRPGITLVDDPAGVFNSDVDVVVVLTSPSSHAELATAAVSAGKHVVCEKPLGLDRREAAAAFAAASRADRHLLAAPFVHLSPTLGELWTRLDDGEIGDVRAARALYGNLGAPWSEWFRRREVGPLAEVGVYNLKSLTALLGPVTEVTAMTAPAGVDGRESVNVLLRHASGAVSTVTASDAMHRYRRPAIELYGDAGTANLLGDDWDPAGIELWRAAEGAWTTYDSPDRTWLWTDGLAELVTALAEGRQPRSDPTHDLHVLDIVDRAAEAASSGRTVEVTSSHERPDLRIDLRRDASRVHDHTRAPEDQ